MARPYRLNIPGACYLVHLRGTAGLGLFVEPADAQHFVTLLDRISRKQRVKIHAYGLAENGAALVAETPEANLGRFLQGVQTAFARYIRQHYEQKGAIMRGRYQAKLLEIPGMLTPACVWTHAYPALAAESPLTPAARLRHLRRHPFSSYLHAIGEGPEGCAQPETMLRAYGAPARDRPRAHAAACEQLILIGNPAWEAAMEASPLAIGSADFLDDLQRKHQAVVSGRRVKGLREHGSRPRGIARGKITEAAARGFGVEPAEFFRQRHHSLLRPALSALLYQYAAMTQREIADYLQLGSAAAVSLQIRKLLTQRAGDPVLDQTLRNIERSLG